MYGRRGVGSSALTLHVHRLRRTVPSLTVTTVSLTVQTSRGVSYRLH
jgi:hypothetical protein